MAMQSESATDSSGKNGLFGSLLSMAQTHPKALFFLVAVIFALFLVRDEFTGDKPVVIEPIEVPKELSEKASTNVAVTRQLVDAADALARRRFDGNFRVDATYPMQRLSSPPGGDGAAKPRPGEMEEPSRDSKLESQVGISIPEVSSASTTGLEMVPLMRLDSEHQPDIEVPTFGSVRSAVRLLKGAVGLREIHITGEISIQPDSDNKIRLVLRSSSASALEVDPIERGDLNSAIREGGEALLKLAYPCIAASYYYRREVVTKVFSNTSQLIEPCRNDRIDVRYIADLISGLIAYEQERYPEAVRQYATAAANAPDERKKADVYFHWGRALERQQNFAQARAKFEEAKQADPDYVNAYIGLASLAGEQAEKTTVMKDLQEICDRNPQKAVDCGNALMKLGMPDDAIVHYRRALESDSPRTADIHVFLANALLDQKKTEEAIGHYEKAIDLQQDHVIAHNNLGIALYSGGNYTAAIDEFNKAIAFDKAFMDAYYNYGSALIRLYENNPPGKVAEAIGYYRSLIREKAKDNPEVAASYVFSGVASLTINNAREAIADFETVERLAGNIRSADFYNYWGNALLQMAKDRNITYGQADNLRLEAIRKYEKAAEIDPNYYFSYYNQSIAYATLGEERRNIKKADKDLLNKASELYRKSLDLKMTYQPAADRGNPFAGPVAMQGADKDPGAAGGKAVTGAMEPGKSAIMERLRFPIIAVLALLLATLLVLINRWKAGLSNASDGRSTPGLGAAVSPPHGAAPAKEADRASDSVDGNAGMRRRTQVGGYFPPPGLRRPAAVLRCIAGGMENRRFSMEKALVTIGANADSELNISDDQYVSGRHARLQYDKGSLVIRDLGSRNGTFVNGQKVSDAARVLMPGDRIQVGNTTFEIQLS